MLARMDPGQFDEWQTEHNIEPWGDDWLQAGTIAACVEAGLEAILAQISAMLGDGSIEPRAHRASDYYRPKKQSKSGGGRRYLTAEESQRLDRMRCGV